MAHVGLAALTPTAQVLLNSLSLTVPRLQSRYRQRAAEGESHMNVTGFVVMLGFAALMLLAGNVGLVCGRARARAAAGRKRTVHRA